MKRLLSALLIVACVQAALAVPVSAGGWALVELVVPLPGLVAGEEAMIDARLLQHGITPFEGGTPSLTAQHRSTGTSVTVNGTELDNEPGTYRFALTLPAAGEWKWYITNEPFGGMTTFPVLTVQDGDATPDPAVATTSDPVISIRNMNFAPTRLEITAGTTVTWVNDDAIPHQVGSTTAIWFDDSPMLQPGERYEFTFDRPGEFQYLCGPHMGMVGVVVVT